MAVYDLSQAVAAQLQQQTAMTGANADQNAI